MGVIYYHTMPTLENYFRPATVEEAVSLLSRYGEGAKILAGGTDLLVLMRSRTIIPNCIIDITRIPGLDFIDFDEADNLRIGALVTIRAVELSKMVKEEFPLLHEASCKMGTTQIRHMATVVGNICRASPSADMACPLLALEADVKIVGPTQTRTVALSEFSPGSDKTVLRPEEMVTEIRVPKLATGTGTAFLRATRVASDLAKVNVATVLTLKNGVCADVKIVLGAVAPTLMRAHRAEEVIRGKKIDEALVDKSAQAASDEAHPRPGSLRASPEYKKKIAKVLTRRAITTSLERAQGKVER